MCAKTKDSLLLCEEYDRHLFASEIRFKIVKNVEAPGWATPIYTGGVLRLRIIINNHYSVTVHY